MSSIVSSETSASKTLLFLLGRLATISSSRSDSESNMLAGKMQGFKKFARSISPAQSSSCTSVRGDGFGALEGFFEGGLGVLVEGVFVELCLSL